MATNNSTIMEKVWLNASNDFQHRVPKPTQNNIAATQKFLFSPMNRQYFNDFVNVLINRVAFSYVRGQAWRNRLAPMKGQKINYGSTIQEIAPKWIKAHAYDVSDQTLLKLARPEAAVWYHSQNRQDRYDISVSFDDLRTAFVDEYGLNNFIAAVMETPINSDEYDEYRIMMQLLAFYDNNFGFFKKKVDPVTDEVSAKAFLKELRATAGYFEFPSARYNAAGVDIPVFAKNSELVIMMTPDTQAAIDVDALASVFNLDKADIMQRVIIVDEFPMPNVVALLTTEDFFVCNDTVYENTNFWNPQTLVNNYYLHHWGIYSVSPFVPCCLFVSDGESTSVPVVTQNVTGVTLDMASATVEPGGEVPITVKLIGTVTPNTYPNLELVPDSVTFDVSAYKPGDAEADPVVPDTPVQLNSRTYVDRYGVLHVQKSISSGTVITVTGTTTYVNPSGKTTEYTASETVTVA